MSLYWLSVFHRKKSIVFQLVIDYVSMRLLSSHNSFGDHPSQFSSSGTHRINTRRNVTVPDVSLFHHKESIVLRLGAWLCKHETALLTHSFGDHPSQFSSSGTHRINTSSNVTVPDVSVFHHKEPIVFQLGAWLCKHETALLTQFIWRPSVLQLCCSGTHRSIHVGMSLYLMSVYSITRSQLCSIGCLIM